MTMFVSSVLHSLTIVTLTSLQGRGYNSPPPAYPRASTRNAAHVQFCRSSCREQPFVRSREREERTSLERNPQRIQLRQPPEGVLPDFQPGACQRLCYAK